ncbi:MAG TPA: response regulator, partial [Geobacterales bacterium]|nr:response regulator [Geobacterales bacterium]
MPPLLHLLIIDDSKDDAWLLWHNLKRGGYDVEYEVVDSAEGMRASLADKKWDLITSDHAMPRFSAPAALALARELCPEVPFIIVSGEIDLNLAVSLMRAGADDYVQKRELALLVPAVQRVLSKTNSRRAAKQLEEAFRASEMRYRRLFETAKDGILILNAATSEVVDVNPFLQEMLGYAHADIVGKKLWDI